jgi:hypothetical protein
LEGKESYTKIHLLIFSTLLSWNTKRIRESEKYFSIPISKSDLQEEVWRCTGVAPNDEKSDASNAQGL